MGYLQDMGIFYDYYESLPLQRKIKEKGIIQFLFLMKKYQNYQVMNHHYDHVGQNDEEYKLQTPTHKPDAIFWGDEFEGHIVKIDHNEKRVMIQPNLSALFNQLEQNHDNLSFTPMPEFGSWMLETTPDKPYLHMDYNVCLLLRSVRARYRQIQEYLPTDTHYLLLPVFPRLGVGNFSVTVDSDLNAKYMEKVRSQPPYTELSPQGSPKQASSEKVQPSFMKLAQKSSTDLGQKINNEFSQSIFFDDRLINPHPRYSCITLNHRLRRKSKAEIKIPIYKDVNTSFQKTEDEPFPGFIFMDHLGFGMGNCCLQMTFLSKDIKHARHLYDQLAVISPLFIALSAGSAIFKGKLSDWDTKWDSLAMATDDRTVEERDPQHPTYIPKTKYSSISAFISEHEMNLPEYNDLKFPVNTEIMDFARLKSKEMGVPLDERLIYHLGVLFRRDAMIIFKDKVEVNDEESTNHFENIQSTNWNSVRFKPPPSQNSKIGWRVEFRTTEIQVTPDENSVFSLLILRITQLFYYNNIKVNFYIPISLVDKNFEISRQREAVTKQKFYFRTNIEDDGPPVVDMMTLDEIFFGKAGYIGIIPLIEKLHVDFLKQHEDDFPPERVARSNILYQNVNTFIRKKTTGELKTLASYIRDFVLNHPDYKKDSIVSDLIQYDLVTRLIGVAKGQIVDPQFPVIFTTCNH